MEEFFMFLIDDGDGKVFSIETISPYGTSGHVTSRCIHEASDWSVVVALPINWRCHGRRT